MGSIKKGFVKQANRMSKEIAKRFFKSTPKKLSKPIDFNSREAIIQHMLDPESSSHATRIKFIDAIERNREKFRPVKKNPRPGKYVRKLKNKKKKAELEAASKFRQMLGIG